jgi:hypothetical protein
MPNGQGVPVILPSQDLTEAKNIREITKSLGATACKPWQSLEDILDRVDLALYQSKHEGRNRMSVFENYHNLRIFFYISGRVHTRSPANSPFGKSIFGFNDSYCWCASCKMEN